MKRKMSKAGMVVGVLVMVAAGVVVYPHNQMAAMATMPLYFVQEMLAALLLFSIGFAVIAGVILVLFMLDQGLCRTSAWTGTYAAKQLHAGWVQLDHCGRREVHRF